jgi:hypothetical protein
MQASAELNFSVFWVVFEGDLEFKVSYKGGVVIEGMKFHIDSFVYNGQNWSWAKVNSYLFLSLWPCDALNCWLLAAILKG